MLCGIARAVFGDRVEGGRSANKGFEAMDDAADDLRQQLVERVENIAEAGLLWEQHSPGDVVWFWRNAGREEQVRRFTRSALENLAGVKAVSNMVITPVRSTSGNYEQVNVAMWSKLLDVDQLTDRVKQYAASLPESEA
jgi:hypothetical protein